MSVYKGCSEIHQNDQTYIVYIRITFWLGGLSNQTGVHAGEHQKKSGTRLLFFIHALNTINVHVRIQKGIYV